MAGLSKKTFAALLLASSAFLFWYSVCSYKIWKKNPNVPESSVARAFPLGEFLYGRSEYLALAPQNAAESYKKALFAQPSLIDAWMGLVRVRLDQGRTDEARRILSLIAPDIASVSTWKWEELLFAYELHDDRYFESCFDYILARLPNRASDAGWLSSRFWRGWEKVIPHVREANQPVFLNLLVNDQQLEGALALLKLMPNAGARLNENDTINVCQFLIAKDRIKEAKVLWLEHRQAPSLIYDPGFESPPLDRAFGWIFKKDPNAVLERLTGQACLKGSCLHIHFSGATNVNGNFAYQIVPVDPQASYCLHFARKSRSLTTDRGVFVQIGAFGQNSLEASSEPSLGDSPWKEEQIYFTAPAGCEAVYLRIRRDESLKLDNRISGDYWIGSLNMKKQP